MTNASLYIPGNSFFHKCDVRVKLFMLVVVSAVSFTFFTPYIPFALLMLSTIGTVYAIGVKPTFTNFLTKMIYVMMFFLIVLHGFVNPAGHTPALFFGKTVSLPFFGYYTLEGFYLGIVFWLRLSAVIMCAELFICTTAPADLVMGLNKLGMPYNFCFMISMSLQLIPIAMREATIINSAQQARGLPDKTIADKFKGLLPMFVPLIVSSLERMEHQSMALECRGFGYTDKPTDLSDIVMRVGDYVLLVALVVLGVGAVVLRIKCGNFDMSESLTTWADCFKFIL